MNSLINHSEEKANRQTVVHDLIQESHIGRDFYFLLIVSTLITTLGLTVGNAAVIIGGMLIAPLLSPILALGLGIVTANQESLFRSAIVILKSIGIVLILSTLTAFLVGVPNPSNLEIVSRIKPSLPFMYIALLSGIAATYSWARPKLSATLPGVAVVVALLPPLATTGIGISEFNRAIITGSFQLFLVNLIGIAISSAIVFSLMGFHQMRWIEKKELDKEKEEDGINTNKEDTTGKPTLLN
ncbi:TIGR00341 family protein [candidate division WWE3 bacterium]|uniref:TIGR00341 family protein n=1 Tax=candidate division WWE3 bacterium TaxID=2053526 RepID=A0A955RWP1_UNCKA|nr:TIGR00341 family protein [candidate division WWE3 bacterium]